MSDSEARQQMVKLCCKDTRSIRAIHRPIQQRVEGLCCGTLPSLLKAVMATTYLPSREKEEGEARLAMLREQAHIK